MKNVWIIDPTLKYSGSVANLRPQELDEGTNLHQEIGEIPNMDTLVESMRKEGNDEAVKVVGREVGQETSDTGREDVKRHYSWNFGAS